MYHIYLSGSKNPVWSYKSWTWAKKRLALLNLTSINCCRIESTCFGTVTEVGQVSFSVRGYGWHIDWKGVK